MSRGFGKRWLATFGSLALFVTTQPAQAATAPPQQALSATPGQGPVSVSTPLTSMPLHGRKPGERVPVLPPSLGATGTVAAAVAPQGGQGAGPQATNLFLLPGLVVADTSFEQYFDAPDIGWTEGMVSLFAASDPTTVLHSVTFPFSQAVACGSPARYCWTLDNGHGWGLVSATKYVTKVTLVAADGTRRDSAPSPAETPRALPKPPPVAPEQLRGSTGTGSTGPTDQPPMIRGVGVNTATGAFTQHAVDAAMSSSYTINVSAERSYSSDNTTSGLMGAGWAFSNEARVFPKPGVTGAVVFRAEDGSESTYTLQPDGTYLAPAGALSQLAAVPGGGWKVTTPAGQKLSFDAGGRELSFLDERGIGVTLGYDAGGRLATVTDAGGRVLKVTVEGGLVRELTLPDHRRVRYGYVNGRLHTVRDPDGDVVATYDYDSAGRLSKITDARHHLQVTTLYDATTGRVSSQADHFGHVTTFAWDPVKQESKVTDPDGAVFFDGYMGNVLQYTQNGNGDTNVYRADAKVNNQVLADPLGHQYEMAHDANGSVMSRKVFGASPASEPANVGVNEGSTFDAAGNMTSDTDARGFTTSYTYNQFSQILTVTDPQGATTRFDYYPDTGLLHSVTDPLGHTTTYAYDAAGDKVSQADPLGDVTTFRYDRTGRLVSATDPRGNAPGADPNDFTSTSRYDGEDRLVRAEDARGNVQEWSYDDAGNLRRFTDGDGFSTTSIYNDANQRVTQLDPDGRATRNTYTAAGRLASVTDGAGDVTTYSYDSAGRVKTVTSPRGSVPGADPAQFTITYAYDFNGNRTLESHPFPGGGTAVTQYHYDTLNQLVSVTDPLGRTTNISYDAGGNKTAVTDSLGHTQTWTYDGNNRVLVATDGLGNKTTNHYDAAGRIDRQQTAVGETTTFAYDALGRLVAQTSPRGNAPGADPTKFTTTFAHDGAGNQTSVTDPLGNTSRAAYDADNNVTSRTDANGHTTAYAYDADNRLTRIVGPDAMGEHPDRSHGDDNARATVNRYDGAGHLVAQTDPNGHTTRYTYDDAGRLTSVTDALDRVRQYVYDADGNLVTTLTARATSAERESVRDANTITQQYDILDRLTRTALGSGPVFAYAYDAANELTSLADPSGVETRAYDAAGRLTSAARGAATFTYAYDAAGNLTSRTVPGGAQTLSYDADNRPVSLSGQAGTASYAYDQDGNLTSTQLPGGSAQQRSYDNADRLSTLSDLGPSKQVLSSYSLVRDGVGNPTRLDTTQAGASSSDAFTYDAANRLTAMCFTTTSCDDAKQKLSFAYDLVGNRLTETRSGTGAFTQRYVYDAANELRLTEGGPSETVAYRYDADGNQVQAGRTRSTYDLENQLATVDVRAQKTVFTQDAAGNRVAAQTTPHEGGVTTNTSYQWDVNNQLPMLASEQSDGGQTRSYTYNPSGSPLSLQVGGAGFLFQPDPLGNTAELTDLAGAVQQQFSLNDPFGGFSQVTPGGSAAPDPRLEFQGQYNDPLSGAYHLRARDYTTTTGQFNSADPLSRPISSPSESTYIYANDNPLTGMDPSGLGCGIFAVVCNAAHAAAGAITSAASTVVHTVSSAISTVAQAVTGAVNTVVQAASSAVQQGVNVAKQTISNVKKAVNTVRSTVVGATKAVVHATSDAFHQAAVWVDKHKAQIASIAAAIAVGAACEAVTAGAGTIGCAALAGAVGSMVSYGMTTPSSQLTLGGFITAGVIGGVTGALTGGAGVLLGRVADGVVSEVASGALSRVVGSAESGAADAAESGSMAAVRTAAESCLNSFAADTPVLMADGGEKAIRDVKLGDWVRAEDPQTGETRAEAVEKVIVGHGLKHLIDVSVAGETIEATSNHRFWVVEEQRFEQAGALKPGDHLLLASGRQARVLFLRPHDEVTTVYNLEIHEIHTFFVGADPALVHNMCGSGAAGAGSARFVANTSGDILDTSRVTIPAGKFGYLLNNPAKAGVFQDSMGFDRSSLDSALRQHLVDNFEGASTPVPMRGGGVKFSVQGPMTGPSGESWSITTAWGVEPNGLIRLITATP